MGMNEGGAPETPLIQALLAVDSPMVSRGWTASGQRGKGVKVDVSEVFSPPRVTEMAAQYGLKPGDAFDLTTGWDFDPKEDRERAEIDHRIARLHHVQQPAEPEWVVREKRRPILEPQGGISNLYVNFIKTRWPEEGGSFMNTLRQRARGKSGAY